MNGVLPANIGTFTMLLMYAAIIAGATFASVSPGTSCQVFAGVIIGTFVYLYLFLAVLPVVRHRQEHLDHPVITIAIVAGAVFLIVLLVRIFWRSVKELWCRRSGVA
jgi:uncharacterized protein with PQ loop repeat